MKQMQKGSQNFSRILGEIKKEFFRFADSYAKAVSDGANVTGKNIIEDLSKSDSVQPSDISLGKFISAVKSGVQHAGEQMIKSGVDQVERMKQKAKKQ
ncbi:hypothetical protein FE783_02260 [Paenibacillus mesophilus]|uniref:hypothetical protein n=1 Tax=Paenibacillus mesophilus TaxID=2582849 RepID=UPI00110D987C|nr:hypothetical protein [Paenibacillus mesophilus]TMV53030.1 hypothetical protein FE783_02260 [Paenibacillus mesophilus]